ncbi:hypothetical protein EUTSA_v10009938mg, partial [Eutrema salsugineum]
MTPSLLRRSFALRRRELSMLSSVSMALINACAAVNFAIVLMEPSRKAFDGMLLLHQDMNSQTQSLFTLLSGLCHSYKLQLGNQSIDVYIYTYTYILHHLLLLLKSLLCFTVLLMLYLLVCFLCFYLGFHEFYYTIVYMDQ